MSIKSSAQKLLAFGQEHSPFLLVCAGAATGLYYAGRTVPNLYARTEAANYERALGVEVANHERALGVEAANHEMAIGDERLRREIESSKTALLQRLLDFGYAQEWIHFVLV